MNDTSSNIAAIFRDHYGSLGQDYEDPESATNIIKAREAFEKALRTFAEKSYEWAQTKGDLARTLVMIGPRLPDDPMTTLTEALKNIDEALLVFSDPRFNVERAEFLVDRSGVLLAFSDLTQGEARQRHLKAAISASEDALKTLELVFNCVKNFIRKNSQFDRHRNWLIKLFEAFEASPRDRIISELTRLRRPN